MLLAPAIALLTKGKYYIARADTYSRTLYNDPNEPSTQCNICEQVYEPPDMLYCPVYASPICSLCCSLDACCHDACKVAVEPVEIAVPPHDAPSVTAVSTLSGGRAFSYPNLSHKVSPQFGNRFLRYLWVFISLSGIAGAALAFVYHQQMVAAAALPSITIKHLTATLLGAYGIFLVLIGIGSWWLVLTQESRQLAQEELDQRNLQLQQEVQERLLAETQLQEKAQQLEKTLLELQQAEAQLIQTEKMAALGGLVAGIAHEINTPIGIGVTAASLLMEKTEAFSALSKTGTMKRSDLERFLDIAQQSSRMALTNLNRAAELIQSFKQVAVDQSSESKRVFNVKLYLEEILLQLSPKLRATPHHIVVECDRSLTFNSYPGAFSQIVTNLVLNSLLHAFAPDQSGAITLTARRSHTHLLFEYADNGSGIAPPHLDKIFDPFFTTKRGQGGSGLGLHIVYNLVTQKLGGTIQCESQPGHGTKFIITLPF